PTSRRPARPLNDRARFSSSPGAPTLALRAAGPLESLKSARSHCLWLILERPTFALAHLDQSPGRRAAREVVLHGFGRDPCGVDPHPSDAREVADDEVVAVRPLDATGRAPEAPDDAPTAPPLRLFRQPTASPAAGARVRGRRPRTARSLGRRRPPPAP